MWGTTPFVRSQAWSPTSTTSQQRRGAIFHQILLFFNTLTENSFTVSAPGEWEMGVCLLAPKMFNKASLKVKTGRDPEGKTRQRRARMDTLLLTSSTMLEPAKSGPMCVWSCNEANSIVHPCSVIN